MTLSRKRFVEADSSQADERMNICLPICMENICRVSILVIIVFVGKVASFNSGKRIEDFALILFIVYRN